MCEHVKSSNIIRLYVKKTRIIYPSYLNKSILIRKMYTNYYSGITAAAV